MQNVRQLENTITTASRQNNMTKKTIKALNELYPEDKSFQENMDVIAISPKGQRYPYFNVKTEETLRKIVDYRKGWDIKVIYK